MAVALRLGLDFCVPHTCRCGALVDSRGTHSFVCKHAPGRKSRHHNVNDVMARALLSAGIHVTKEPNGLSRGDGKRPDGMTLIPFQGGKPLVWDVTVATTIADPYVEAASREAGAAAELAAGRKLAKYAELASSYIVQPVAIESLGPYSNSAREYIEDVGCRIAMVWCRERSENAPFCFSDFQFAFSVLIQFCCTTVFFSCFLLDHPVEV